MLIKFILYHSDKRSPGGSGLDNWRCQNKYLVTCVQRFLQVAVAFQITNRSTLGLWSTVAHRAINHLSGMMTSKSTSSFTLGRNHTSVHSGTCHATEYPPLRSIPWSTLGKNYTSAINVNLKQQDLAIWRDTKGRTLEKSLTDAQYASIQAINQGHWKGIWWESTQEKSRSNVNSATTLSQLLEICSSTLGRTQLRDHSSATNVIKLSNRRGVSQAILGRTWLQIRCLI